MNETTTDDRGAVLVTGASTGIGRATTRLLARSGYLVFAGVRREEDAQALRQDNLTIRPQGRAAASGDAGPIEPLLFDVADWDSIAAASAQMRLTLGERGLVGLVNNAGIVVAAPLELTPLAQFEMQMRVNVTGVVAVTQAVLDLLRRERGRVINIGSIAGRFALPMMGPYSASKHALEALSDALRLELRPWGMAVALLEPGPVGTPIWAKARQRSADMAGQAGARALDLYAPLIAAMERAVTQSEADAIDVELVAATILEALTAPKPKTRYPLGRHVALRIALRRFLPDRAVDWVLLRALGLH